MMQVLALWGWSLFAAFAVGFGFGERHGKKLEARFSKAGRVLLQTIDEARFKLKFAPGFVVIQSMTITHEDNAETQVEMRVRS